MRVLPIIFNTDMVRAILDGRKTVTRRAIKGLPKDAEFQGQLLDSTCREDENDIGKIGFKTENTTEKAGCIFVKLPCQPGDILYVRETYCPDYFAPGLAGYRGDGLRGNRNAYKTDYHKEIVGDVVPEPKWAPSIHMPKAAARIWLKVTDVRVERLQDAANPLKYPHGKGNTIIREGNKYTCDFIAGWNKTIKKTDLSLYGWDANPWVWVIEFKRCEKPQEAPDD